MTSPHLDSTALFITCTIIGKLAISANGLFGSLDDSKRAGIIIKFSTSYSNIICPNKATDKNLKKRIFSSKIFKKCYTDAAGNKL